MQESIIKQERLSAESYNQFLRQADVAFLKAVGKRVNARQRYCVCKAGEGIAVSFLLVQGTDSSDFSLNGAVSMDLVENEAVVHLDFDAAYRGKIMRRHQIKVGLMTVDLVADMILEIIGISRVRMV